MEARSASASFLSEMSARDFRRADDCSVAVVDGGDGGARSGRSVPSLRCLTVLDARSCSPLRTALRTSSSSDWRSAGMMVRIDLPIISLAV